MTPRPAARSGARAARVMSVLALALAVALCGCDRKPAPGAGGDATRTAAPPVAVPANAAPSAADAFLLLPGDYGQHTTVADLEARFGKAHVRVETVPEPRLVLFPDDPTRRAFVTFHEAEAFRELAGIRVVDAGSRWRGKRGLQVGMPLTQVVALNGKPFLYSGFDDRKRAAVRDGWSPSLDDDDAVLGHFDVAEGDHLYFDVDLGVRDGATVGPTDLPLDEHLRSDDARFPRVGELVIVTALGAHSSLDDEWD